jgi:hypothetical protein
MNYSIYRFSLDVRSTQAQISLPVTLGDTARRLYITLTDGGKPLFFADGCSASLVGVKADGKHILHDCIIEDNTTIRYDFRDSTATALGELQCQILFANASGRVLGSPRFSLIVFKDLLDSDDVVSEDDVETLGRIVGAETARVNAEKARVAAEVARASAESARVAEFETIMSGLGGLASSSARIADVTLLANKWVGTASPYSQVVAVDGATECSQVDLTPSVEQLAIFYEKDLAFVTENEDGVVTVYAIGQKPENDYMIQVTITEVSV